MKKLLFSRKILTLILVVCTLICATQANAGVGTAIGTITGKIFSSVLEFVGFGSGEDGFCWFCPLFTVLFNTINTLATTVATQLTHVLLATLGVGILFFIAFRVGATLIKLQEVDLMQFLGDLFKHLGRAIIAAALIAGTVQIFHHIVSPFLTYALNLSLTFMQSASLTDNAATDTYLKVAVGDITSTAENICAGFQSATASTDTTQAFSNNLLYALRCMLATVSANLVLGMVVGLVVFGMGLVANFIFPDVQMTLSGGVIFISFFMIYLAVPFRLIDNMLRLAFVGALMPFWVILWVFPATVQYTKNAWNMFLAACVNFIAFGVVVALIMQLLQFMVPDMEQILESMIPGYDLIAASKASVFTKNTLLTLALGLFCKSMLQAPEDFSARITQSYGFNVGQGLEGQLTGVASTSLKFGAGVATVGTTMLGSGAAAAAEKVNQIKEQFGIKKDATLLDTFWPTSAKTPEKFEAKTAESKASGTSTPESSAATGGSSGATSARYVAPASSTTGTPTATTTEGSTGGTSATGGSGTTKS